MGSETIKHIGKETTQPDSPKGSSIFKTSVLNVGLRALTMASKFLLLFFMARYLETSELGTYGLVSATIGLAVYILGFDYYTFNTREMLKRDRSEWAKMIRDQFAFHGVMYALILPLLLIVFLLQILPWKYAIWFYLLLVLEHISQEMYRILIALSRPLLANSVLFFRGGAWVYVVIAIMFQRPQVRELPTIWAAWAVGVSISLVLALSGLRRLGWRKVIGERPDWEWIKSGAKVAIPFLGGTIALIGITTLDRYFLKYFHGDASVGVYTFYASIANSVPVFADSAVTMILLPKVVAAYQRGLLDEYHRLMVKLATNLIGVALLMSVIAVLAIRPVTILINKPVYSEQIAVFWVMLASAIIAVLGNIPHFGLYVRRLDRLILLSTAVGLVTAIGLDIVLIPRYGQLGTALAVLGAISVVTVCKTCLLRFRG